MTFGKNKMHIKPVIASYQLWLHSCTCATIVYIIIYRHMQ